MTHHASSGTYLDGTICEMNATQIPQDLRVQDVFQHIDMGFLNRRLCLTALGDTGRQLYREREQSGSGHLTQLGNDHLLVTLLLDMCDARDVPTLLEALAAGKPRCTFRSTERLAPCPEIYEKQPRVEHDVLVEVDFGKPVRIAYHTEHLVSSTGRMTLAQGAERGYRESMVGLLHNFEDRFEIEPLVIGAPWYDHPRNGPDGDRLMWVGHGFGEILPEDIQQFSKMSEVSVTSTAEWMNVMRELPEKKVKDALGALLTEPTKLDWGGENNDHLSRNVIVGGRRKTAAFLLKGPTHFREMTLDMCGKRADQIYRLVRSGADISVVQHCHTIGEAVQETLRALTVCPGSTHRKYCLIDGQATYRILKGNALL